MLSNLLSDLVLDRLASALSEGGLDGPAGADGPGGEAFLDQLKEALEGLDDGGGAGDPGLETADGTWLQWAQALVAGQAVNPVSAGGIPLPGQVYQGLPGSVLSAESGAAPGLGRAPGQEGEDPSALAGDMDRTRLAALAAVLRGRADPASRLEGASQAGAAAAEWLEGLTAGHHPSGAATGQATSTAGIGQLPGAPSPAPGLAQAPPPIPVPVDHSRWGEALGQRMVWMANQDAQSASLQLHPRQLGPLEIHMSIEGDRAQLSFVSNHAAVRDAVETALPRLREMLGTVGLMQIDVNVSGHGSSWQGSGGEGREFAQALRVTDPGPVPGDGIPGGVSRLTRLGDSLVDLYI